MISGLNVWRLSLTLAVWSIALATRPKSKDVRRGAAPRTARQTGGDIDRGFRSRTRGLLICIKCLGLLIRIVTAHIIGNQ
jgi:hypothetical protein